MREIVNMKNNGEFKGKTSQAISDMAKQIEELKGEIKSLNQRFWVILILLAVSFIEHLPQLTKIALGVV